MTTLSSWLLQECYIEFLQVNFKPKLPLGMHVDQCIASIWRVKAVKNYVTFKFNCSLDASLEPSPESGERLLAQSFEDQITKLTIGTEDEEALIARSSINQTSSNRHKKLKTDFLIRKKP